MDRREHDRKPSTEYQTETADTFDHSLFVPGLYEKPGKPNRMRVLFEEEHGLTDIIDEETTSEGPAARSYANGANVNLSCTDQQVRWLHRTLGALVARWDAGEAYGETGDRSEPPGAVLARLQRALEPCGTNTDNPDTCGVCHLHFHECFEDMAIDSDEPGASRFFACPGARARMVLRYPGDETRKAAISVVFQNDACRRVLCVWNERYECWALPGGLVEDGELPADAQARELEEEASLKTKKATLVYEGPHHMPHKPGRASIVCVYLVDAIGEPHETEPGCPVAWKTIDEFLASTKMRQLYAQILPDLAAKQLGRNP